MPAAEVAEVRRRRSRPLETARHYQRRAWRWWRVMVEARPGTVAPAPGQRRVLVVRLDAIGDFALWTGAARALRAWLGPDVHVTLAANAQWAELARDQSIADDVWPVERGRLVTDGGYRAELRRRVRGARFSRAINSCYTREMMLGDSIIRWSCAAERSGTDGDDVLLPARERFWADGWYTRLVPASSAWMHESERHAEFLRALGVPLSGVPRPSLTVRPMAPLDGVRRGQHTFVLSPGASAAEHRWPAAHFAAVAREIVARTGWQPLILGVQADAPLARIIGAAVPQALDLTGRTSVVELADLIKRSRLVVTNDTAAVHIAAATGVHAICIAGGWHWERFVPYPASLGEVSRLVHAVSMAGEMPCFQCRGYCSLPHRAGEPRPCVERVSVERVLATVERVLSLPEMQSDG